MLLRFFLLMPFFVSLLVAQSTITNEEALLKEVLHRLDALEAQNRELLHQIQELKNQSRPQAQEGIAGGPTEAAAPLDERVKVNEARIAEQAQTKVESSQKFPVWLYGTLLFNAFSNSKDPSSALGNYGLVTGVAPSGATMRQTILGFAFQGPDLPGGGHVEGSLETDFWAGPSAPSDNWLRIRRAGISLDWPETTIFAGQDKALISPYQPNSFAEVGVPALAGSGNLWFWLPQIRVSHTFKFSADSGMDVQGAVLQAGSFFSNAAQPASPSIYPGDVSPAFEARVAFWHNKAEERKWEVAPGFHVSSTSVNSTGLVTRIGSLDWLARPVSKIEVKGTAYYGENVAALGGLGNGFYFPASWPARPVVSGGGWSQLAFPLNPHLTFNLFGGLEKDDAGATLGPAIARTASFAGNAVFHLRSNVLLSLEAQRLLTHTFSGQADNYNHYDLAIAYLF